LSFEVQELPDILRIVVLLILSERTALDRSSLKRRIDRYCMDYACVAVSDVDRALKEMSDEALIKSENSMVKLTERGLRLGKEWRNLLLKREPILEIVAGLTDGSITALVVILSTYLAQLTSSMAAFAAVISLAAVAMTNFSSFLLGGKTEDVADLLTLKTLMDYSLSDIPDKIERDKSLRLVKRLFLLLGKQIGRINLYSALVSGVTTFLAGVVPITVYMLLPNPLNLLLSLGIVCLVVGIFLVRYRSKRAKVHWRMTLAETVIIITIAVILSLLIGRGV